MALRHADPVVFNADTAQFQNASYADEETGVPIGVGVGSDVGSEVFSHPLVNKTLTRTTDGRVATIIAATRYRTGSANESEPGLVCTLLFAPGAANEQLGHLVLSGLAQDTGHATLMTSTSPDSTFLSRHETGLIADGTAIYGTDFSFTPVVSQNSNDSTVRLHGPYQLRQDQGASAGKVLTSDANGVGSWQTAPGGVSRMPWDVFGGWMGSSFDIAFSPFRFALTGGFVTVTGIMAGESGTAAKLVLQTSGDQTGTGSILQILDSGGNLQATVTGTDAAFTSATVGQVELTLSGGVTIVAGDIYYVAALWPASVTVQPALALDGLDFIGSSTGAFARFATSPSGGQTTIPNPVPIGTYVDPTGSTADTMPWFALKA
jgi:hypothetical protein